MLLCTPRLFSIFDHLAGRHNVQKVETAGESSWQPVAGSQCGLSGWVCLLSQHMLVVWILPCMCTNIIDLADSTLSCREQIIKHGRLSEGYSCLAAHVHCMSRCDDSSGLTRPHHTLPPCTVTYALPVACDDLCLRFLSGDCYIVADGVLAVDSEGYSQASVSRF